MLLWLGYMFYGEILYEAFNSELFRRYQGYFENYWNLALNKEESVKRLVEIRKKLTPKRMGNPAKLDSPPRR